MSDHYQKQYKTGEYVQGYKHKIKLETIGQWLEPKCGENCWWSARDCFHQIL